MYGINSSVKQVFYYDVQGRLIKIASKSQDGTEYLVAAISYSNNEIIISPRTEPVLQEFHEIRYYLNPDNKPYLRKERLTRQFPAGPQSASQYDLESSESTYQYNTAGVLTKMNTSSFDSTWYNPPQGWASGTKSSSAVTDFFITDNILTKIKTTTQSVFESTNQNGSTTYFGGREEVWDFEYDKQYANKTDYANSLILHDQKIFYVDWFPFNRDMKYFPNKVIYSDAPTGQTGTRTITEYKVTHDKHGYISTITDLTNSSSSSLGIIYSN